MPTSYRNVPLSDHELHTLHLHLMRYFPKTEKIVRNLLSHKSELAHRILLSHFGLRETLSGLRRKSPYKAHDLQIMKGEIHQIDLELSRLKHEQDCFSELHIKLATAFDTYVGRAYPSIIELENRQWKSLAEQYKNLGIKATEADLKKIIELL
jgi:hypothetical protein